MIERDAVLVLNDYAGNLEGSPAPSYTMELLTELLAEVETLRLRAVLQARRDGWQWGRIGAAIGMTKQGARGRYHVADDADRARGQVPR